MPASSTDISSDSDRDEFEAEMQAVVANIDAEPPSTKIGYCSVCQDDILANEDCEALRCAHTYHAECINELVRVTQCNRDTMRCPTCKMTAAQCVEAEQRVVRNAGA